MRASLLRSILLALIATVACATSAWAQRSEHKDDVLTAQDDCTVMDVEGLGTATIELTGTWSATATWYVEGRNDTTNAVDASKADTPGTAVNSSTANGMWGVPVAGYKRLRVCATSYASGTVVVSLLAAGTGGGSGGASGGGGGGDITISGTAPTTGAGNVDAFTLRTTLATDGVAVVALGDIVSNTESIASDITTMLAQLGIDVGVNSAPTTTAGPWTMLEFRDFDGAALPEQSTTEGYAVHAVGSARGVAYFMPTNEDGSLQLGTATTPFVVGGAVANDGADSGNPLKIGGYASTAPPTAVSAAGDRVNAWYTLNGAAVVSPGGGLAHYRTAAGSTEDEHEIKATAGTLYSVLITNTNAAARYIRCYNLTAANTTPGTSTVFWGAAIPGATTGAGFSYTFPAGLTFDTALTCAWTTGAADTDVAEVAANEIKATYSYR